MTVGALWALLHGMLMSWPAAAVLVEVHMQLVSVPDSRAFLTLLALWQCLCCCHDWLLPAPLLA